MNKTTYILSLIFSRRCQTSAAPLWRALPGQIEHTHCAEITLYHYKDPADTYMLTQEFSRHWMDFVGEVRVKMWFTPMSGYRRPKKNYPATEALLRPDTVMLVGRKVRTAAEDVFIEFERGEFYEVPVEHQKYKLIRPDWRVARPYGKRPLVLCDSEKDAVFVKLATA